MLKFFEESNLTSNDLLNFDNILNSMNSNSIDGAFFAGFPLLKLDQNKPMRGIMVCQKGIFCFIKNEEEQKLYKRSVMAMLLNTDNIASLIFSDNDLIKFLNISDNVDRNVEIIKNSDKYIKDDDVREIISIIQQIYNLIEKDSRDVTSVNSLGNQIKKRSEKEAVLDEKQFELIYQKNDTHLRIRGLAGSGKTILLAKKMAYIHFKHPDYNLAYIFYSKSLKQTVDNLFIRFYKEIDCYGGEPDMTKIHIMHSWGSSYRVGFFSTLSNIVNVQNISYNAFNNFDKICEEFIDYIEENKLEEKIKIFDYILIDEAQDFRINFFKLALKSLKNYGKLIYAYDELQTLNEMNSQLPSKKEIFDDENLCNDLDLPVCYRSPMEIIVTAHALGLGIYHKDENGNIKFSNVVEDPNAWISTGYTLEEGNFTGGTRVVMSRKQMIENEINDNIVAFKSNDNDQIYNVIEKIIDLIKNEDILPEDILIIDLDTIYVNENYSLFMDYLDFYLQANNLIKENGKRLFDVHLVNKDSSYNFKIKNFVSYTTIYRAKGNESNIVFIINSKKMNNQTSFNRNKLFTAMTRAKFKVYITGTDDSMDSIIDEINEVKANNYKLDFIYPTKQEMKEYKNRIYNETKNMTTGEKIVEEFKKKTGGNREQLLEILADQCSEEELNKFLKKFTNKENE